MKVEITDAMVERAARRMFGPLNPHWDEKWAALHETGFRQNDEGDFIESKAFFREDARLGLSAVSHDFAVQTVAAMLDRYHRALQRDGIAPQPTIVRSYLEETLAHLAEPQAREG